MELLERHAGASSCWNTALHHSMLLAMLLSHILHLPTLSPLRDCLSMRAVQIKQQEATLAKMEVKRATKTIQASRVQGPKNLLSLGPRF